VNVVVGADKALLINYELPVLPVPYVNICTNEITKTSRLTS